MSFKVQPFQFEVSRDELQKHLTARAKAHVERAEKLEAKATKIRDTKALTDADLKLIERSPMRSAPYGGGMRSPAKSDLIRAALREFTSRAQANKERARQFEFFASHLPNKQSFLLSGGELTAFEFFDAPGWMPYVPIQGPVMGMGSFMSPEDLIAGESGEEWTPDSDDGELG